MGFCVRLCVIQPSDDWTVSPSQAGTRFSNPKQASETFGSFHTECMCVPSVSLCVSVSGITLCVSHTPHCRSRVVSDPIMSAQLSPGSSCPLVPLWLYHGFPFLPLLKLLSASGFFLGLRISLFQPSLFPA